MKKRNLSYTALLSVTLAFFASAYVKNRRKNFLEKKFKSYRDKIKSFQEHNTLYLQKQSIKFCKNQVKIEEIIVSRSLPYFYLNLCHIFLELLFFRRDLNDKSVLAVLNILKSKQKISIYLANPQISNFTFSAFFTLSYNPFFAHSNKYHIMGIIFQVESLTLLVTIINIQIK